MSKSTLAHDEALIRLARTVSRLESKCRLLRSQLREASKDLRHARKSLRVYAQSVADRPWNEQAPPLRTFSEKL